MELSIVAIGLSIVAIGLNARILYILTKPKDSFKSDYEAFLKSYDKQRVSKANHNGDMEFDFSELDDDEFSETELLDFDLDEFEAQQKPARKATKAKRNVVKDK